MKRTTSFFAALVFLSVSPLIIAQEPNPIPPYSSSDLLGPDLIAWTEQQRPQPMPAPFPDPPGQRPVQRQEEKSAPVPAPPAITTSTVSKKPNSMQGAK